MIDKKKTEEAARRNADKYRNCPTLSDEDRDKVSVRLYILEVGNPKKILRKKFLIYNLN